MIVFQIIIWTLFIMMSLSKWLTGKFNPAMFAILLIVSTTLIFISLIVEIILSYILFIFKIKLNITSKLIAITRLCSWKLIKLLQ
jgi:hypothetical protein